MTTILEMARHAAGQSDRYIMIVVTCVLFFFGWLVVRWLANRTNEQNNVLVAIAKEQNETAKHLAAVIALNTSALMQNTDELRHHRMARIGETS